MMRSRDVEGSTSRLESTDPIAIQELSDERLGIYLDGGRTWKDIQGECEIDD